MVALGFSPPARPVILVPTSPNVGARTGGILINKQDSLDLHARNTSDPPSPLVPSEPARGRPPVPMNIPTARHTSGDSMGSNGDGAATSPPPRIRFAPLPEPRAMSIGHSPHDEKQDYDWDDDEHALADGSEDEDDEESRRRSWGMSAMGMPSLGMGNWMGTKKLLTGSSGKPKDEPSEYTIGAPLKKSVSTGGLIGTSPFRSTQEVERRRSMIGTSPQTSSFMAAMGAGGRRGSTASSGSNSGSIAANPNAHRRGSSGDMNPAVKMLNGRVYGARRASEAAIQEKMRREASEPAFVEWGSGQGGGGVGSQRRPKSADDEDDGSGMAWIRKRREERERREREVRESREADERRASQSAEAGGAASQQGDVSPTTVAHPAHNEEIGPMGERLTTPNLPPGSLSSSASSSSSTPEVRSANGPLTPHEAPAVFAAFPPEIQVTAPGAPKVEAPLDPTARRPSDAPSHPHMDSDQLVQEPAHDSEAHFVQAIQIPGSSPHPKDPQEDYYDDDGEDDGDFENDDEEEENLPDIRMTSSAAGVEVMSRHK